ncbi:putative LRR receptor-like serine/threonine-protein kinase MEE39 [Ananas comosus]|uniref:Putative LRR receptor-like serine/threonine-protein kinase MEE39 n=1 Tax=Ananas comosus TaxID=4615 RepID=A0A199UPM2_ANACO|nr:putative LRR receptor-like serine/threonine-protein kinase MEE39 [Ananas comosus]
MRFSFCSLLLLLLLLVAIGPSHNDALPLPRGYYINCGAAEEETIGSIRWLKDEGFTSSGNATKIAAPTVVPVLSTLRFFPDASARKHCYEIPVIKGAKYLVRTTYFYGAFDGGDAPPVFDQIVEGTWWSAVDTADAYAQGLAAYYEIIVAAQGRMISVCLARNNATASSGSPFISALELVSLEDSMYNSTDFESFALNTIARHGFGYNGPIISYPDDQFSRYWAPFKDANPVVQSHSNISSADFWNLPPEKALQTALTTSRGKQLVVHWPDLELPNASYHLVLYFQDNRTPSPFSWRVFDVTVNGEDFYRGLNVSTAGVVVYGTQVQLGGKTQITLTPDESSPVGPVINAGEIFLVVPLGGRTVTRDVIAMEELKRSLKNPPPDWSGDPCLPPEHSWTGVVCSPKDFRVEALHLNDNQFSGPIPSALGTLESLTQLYLQNNKFTGKIPDTLRKKPGLDMQTHGNQLS